MRPENYMPITEALGSRTIIVINISSFRIISGILLFLMFSLLNFSCHRFTIHTMRQKNWTSPLIGRDVKNSSVLIFAAHCVTRCSTRTPLLTGGTTIQRPVCFSYVLIISRPFQSALSRTRRLL